MSLTTLITSSVVPYRQIPTALIKGEPSFGVIGSVVKLDGRLSADPDGNDLTYTWTYDSVPIGSRVMGEDFRSLEADSSVVSFSPDVVGEYVIGLVVSNGTLESTKAQFVTSIRAILVPHGRGIVPDGKWIWSYIRDVWQQVDNKELFETLWSSLIQIVGADLLKLYEVDFNKSIRDTQDLFQRRWLSYAPEVEVKVNGPDFYFGNHYAGTNGATINLGLKGSLIILSATEVVIIEGSVLQNVAGETLTILSSIDEDNIGSYNLTGTNSPRNGYKVDVLDPIPVPEADLVAENVEFVFELQSRNWELSGVDGVDYALLMAKSGSPLDYLLPESEENDDLIDVQVGDVIQYRSGPNKGFYRITALSGSFIQVDRNPPGFSDEVTSATHKAFIYRPVQFEVTQPDTLLTDTIVIPFDPEKDISNLAPGRVVVLNGQAYTLVRSSVDYNQRVPMVILTVDRAVLVSGQTGLSWRTPPTLISTTQDFEVDGINTGDILKFNLVQDGTKVSEVPLQVVGVDRGNLGFVLSDEPVVPGVVPEVPNSFYLNLARDFGIDGVEEEDDGTLSFSGTALKYKERIESVQFQREYWNVRLTPETEIKVNPSFLVKPRTVLRTNLIPVDETLRSVPLLQNFIAKPETVERDGITYQLRNGVEYELEVPPLYLKENIDYVVDGTVAFEGKLVFKTGTNIVEADDGDFIDRGIGPGDTFVIESPITLARTYYIESVDGPNKLTLSREIPLYAGGEFVTAKVKINRRRDGHFIRFVPGKFSVGNPAPKRLWAEVSFFDNNENIENNFGILVGLTRDDISAVSSDLNYRQAVAGMMFAFLRGSALERVRLGAQILLGLPFAEHRGIIRSIEPDYRLDVLGSPDLGRLLIEDIDSAGTPLGTLRVYTYPIEPVSALGGLEVNPETDELYKVGDTVDLFAALSKGVEVSDYVSSPVDLTNFSVERILQQYHSLRVRINDTIFGLNEISLVSSFLKKITPSYVSFFISSLSEFADDVTVTDFLNVGVTVGDGSGLFVDNASFSIPATLMMDSRNGSGINQVQWDDGIRWIRRSGWDLVATGGSSTVTITAGGVLNERAGEDFESPLTKPGDYLIIVGGLNAGTYTISSATDSTVTVSDAPPLGFQTDVAHRYYIVRLLRTVLKSGTGGAVTSGNGTIVLSGGLRTDGVGPGDWLINKSFHAFASVYGRYTIKTVEESSLGSGVWDRVTVTPTPDANMTIDWAIVRPTLIESPSTNFSVTAAGTNVLTTAEPLLPGMVEIGDELQIQNTALDRLIVLADKHLYVHRTVGAGTFNVKLIKKNRTALSAGFDHVPFLDPYDPVEMAIKESQARASTTATSAVVTLQTERTTAPAAAATALNPQTLFIKPGDMLKLDSGADSTVDVGYGAGVYPIVAVSAINITLVVNLSATASCSWRIIRRR